MQRLFRTVLVLALLSLAASGCGGDGEGAEAAAATLPAALQGVESKAEDAFDHALAADFEAVRADAAAVAQGWNAYRAQAEADGAAAADLAAMDVAVSAFQSAAADATDAVVLARAANAVSAPMDELFALYDPPTPPVVLALDYLGREVVLDARQADFAGAGVHIDALAAGFAGIRAALVAGGGAQQAADYDASVAALGAAVTAADGTRLEAEARAGLELVDAMEGVCASVEVAD